MFTRPTWRPQKRSPLTQHMWRKIVVTAIAAGVLVIAVVVALVLILHNGGSGKISTQAPTPTPGSTPVVTKVLAHVGQKAVWSPTGDYVVSVNKGHVELWDSKTGHSIANPLGFVNNAEANAWSADSSSIATQLTGSPWVLIWSPKGHDVVAIPVTDAVQSLAWSPHGSELAIASGQTLQVVDNDGNVVFNYNAGSQIESVAWSPDGSRLSLSEN